MAGDDYREASLRIWEEMATGWEGHRRSVWEASREVGEWLVDALVQDPRRRHMDLDDRSINGVLCRWAYMLMADPGAALAETRRVLGDGGRAALSVWGDPERNPWASIPARALLEQTGAEPPDPLAPGIFAMASEERTRGLLKDAGLEPQRVSTRMPTTGITWST